jgi:prepilin-type N-terminal cleavage/methylation domain-containing protein
VAQDESGFTVLEMLVALCILGLLSAYTMQTFQHIRRMYKVLDSIDTKYTVGSNEQHLRTIVATA